MLARLLVPALFTLSACSLYDHGNDPTAHSGHGGGSCHLDAAHPPADAGDDAPACFGPNCPDAGGCINCSIDGGLDDAPPPPPDAH